MPDPLTSLVVVIVSVLLRLSAQRLELVRSELIEQNELLSSAGQPRLSANRILNG